MTNYYEELHLDAQASAAKLTDELIKQEFVYHRREMQRPEESARKLLLISEAKKVFATEAAKRAYDRELNAPKPEEERNDPAAERRAQFDIWRTNAENYLYSGQYDLAKTALEKALSYDSGENDAGFQNLAARIYKENGDLSSALSRINKAIVLEPNEAYHLLIKALIYELAYRNSRCPVAQVRQTLQEAQSLAARTGDTPTRARAMGCEAFFWQFESPSDSERAGRLAVEAVRLGDDWGNARKVLDDIARKKKAAEQAEIDRIQREKERAKADKEREQQEKEAAAKKAALEARRRRAFLYRILGFSGMVFSLVAGFNDLTMFLKFIPYIPAQTLDAIAIVSVFAIGYSENDFESFAVPLGHVVLYGIIGTSVYYTEVGWNAAGVTSAWKHLAIFLVCYLAAFLIGTLIGKRLLKY